MSDREEPRAGTSPRPAESDWERRRRLAAVFGDALPATTSDEREPEPGADRAEDAGEAWLWSQVPPHHGGH